MDAVLAVTVAAQVRMLDEPAIGIHAEDIAAVGVILCWNAIPSNSTQSYSICLLPFCNPSVH
jgi:hypothetical protein